MKRVFLSKLFGLIYLLCSLLMLSSHGGKTISKGPDAGCHFEKKTKSMHCHQAKKPDAPNKEKVNLGKYNRKLYPHWIDRDSDCQNERQEILIGRSLVPVILKTNRKGRKCTVVAGTWRDFYYSELLTEASQIDVDHVIPLKHAHEAGAKNWSRDKRRTFANDPENLVLTNKKYNRMKGAKSPLLWLPSDKDYACRYFKRWLFVKDKYQLDVSQAEREEYKAMKCPSPKKEDLGVTLE